MKKLLFLFTCSVFLFSCNKPFYCHCSAKEELIGEMNSKKKSEAKSECDTYETAESGDCYITHSDID